MKPTLIFALALVAPVFFAAPVLAQVVHWSSRCDCGATITDLTADAHWAT